MKNFYIDKFEYNYNCSQKIIQLITENPSTYNGRLKTLICHTLNAHHIWNCRILDSPPPYMVWQEYEIESLQDLDLENYRNSLQILETKKLDSKIHYNNTKGLSFCNTVADILFHIINHSTYHRGQIMNHLKTQGVNPVVTDYIFYKRTNK